MRRKLNLKKTLTLMVALNILQTLGVILIAVLEVVRKDRIMTAGQLTMLPFLLLMSLAGTLVAVSLVHPLLVLMIRLRQTEESLKHVSGLNIRSGRRDTTL
jgi:hypothetical protein